MRRALSLTRAVLLTTAITILGWAATSDPTPAYAGAMCADSGDDCNVLHNGKLYKLDEKGAPAY